MTEIRFRGKDFNFRIGDEVGRLWRGDVLINVRPKVWHLLKYLAQRPRTQIPKNELLQAVWGDVHVGPESVDQALSQLRGLLGDDANDPQFIRVIAKKGLVFVAEVETAEEVNASHGPDSRVESTNRSPVSSQPSSSMQWTVRCVRIGLAWQVLAKSDDGVSLSVGFTSALREIVKELNDDALSAVFGRLPHLCMRAILRIHPGGVVSEEDVAYLSNEIHVRVLDSALTVASSYGLLAGNSDDGFAFSGELKDEVVDAFFEEEDTRADVPNGVPADRRTIWTRAVLRVCEAAALAKGDGDPLNAKMVMLGLSMYMAGTGLLDRILNEEWRDQGPGR